MLQLYLQSPGIRLQINSNLKTIFIGVLNINRILYCIFESNIKIILKSLLA